MSERPLVLAGFMGAGKTTVGQLCAKKLGFEFIDTDQEIERREGARVPDIFKQKGEPYFRAREAELASELAGRAGMVIATGGGLIANDANRGLLLSSCVCVGLTASPTELLRRLGPDAAQQRPMLQGPDPAARVADLLKQRAPAYAQLHYSIQTDAGLPEEIAERVCAAYRAEQRRIPVKHPAGHYDIVMGRGTLDQIGALMAGRGFAKVCLIVADENTGLLYAGRVQAALAQAGFQAAIHQMAAGEATKHLATVEGIYRACAQAGLERGSALIALGGGVVGDVAGFAAATYLRGISFVQAPTSLLAMADSSIGGKVGVDTGFGKNLVGAFKQPELVVIDLDCLDTLPAIEIACGWAEIVKAAYISGGPAFARLQSFEVEPSLLDAILLKREVVEEDPYEHGRRALLNLGHTFGHGIEAWSGYSLKHGQCVALGMICAARLSRTLGLADSQLVEQMSQTLRRVGLPASIHHVEIEALHYDSEVERIRALMGSDKKKRAGKLRFVVLRGPGDCFLTDAVGEAQVQASLASLGG